MKNLQYFEKQADALRNENIDYRLVTKAELVLTLMKNYKKENNVSYNDYRKVFDKWFAKYH